MVCKIGSMARGSILAARGVAETQNVNKRISDSTRSVSISELSRIVNVLSKHLRKHI
jgi:hypothetical protein